MSKDKQNVIDIDALSGGGKTIRVFGRAFQARHLSIADRIRVNAAEVAGDIPLQMELVAEFLTARAAGKRAVTVEEVQSLTQQQFLAVFHTLLGDDEEDAGK